MNVILITIDALRYDCILNETKSPFTKKYKVNDVLDIENISNYAKKGVLFNKVISTAPNTPPSHASIFSGLYPPRHGIRSFFHRKLPQEVKTVFEIFSNNGYKTFCGADKTMFNDILEISRGCDYVIDHDEGDEKLFEKLGEHNEDDIFLFQRFLDVHFPYLISKSPPTNDYLEESYKSTKKICNKYGIEFILDKEEYSDITAHRDQWFLIKEKLSGNQTIDDILVPEYIKGINKFDSGRFKYYFDTLEKLEILDDALIVIMSDHGESVIHQHKVEDGTRRFDHCYANIDDLVRVPVVFTGSAVNTEEVTIDSLSSTIDVLPTILDITEIPEPSEGYNIQGTSLVPLITGSESSGSVGYSELQWWNDGQFGDAETFKNRFYSNNSILDYEALLRHRSVRDENHRYVILGEELSNTDWKKDTESFVRTAIRKIRADWDTHHEELVAEYSRLLDDNEINREELVDELYHDALLNNRYALYDLEDDPFEEVNLLHIDDSRYDDRAQELHKEIKRICSIAANEENIPIKEAEDDENVLRNLKDLGYL